MSHDNDWQSVASAAIDGPAHKLVRMYADMQCFEGVHMLRASEARDNDWQCMASTATKRPVHGPVHTHALL